MMFVVGYTDLDCLGWPHISERKRIYPQTKPFFTRDTTRLRDVPLAGVEPFAHYCDERTTRGRMNSSLKLDVLEDAMEVGDQEGRLAVNHYAF
jgi:hypothetical protein